MKSIFGRVCAILTAIALLSLAGCAHCPLCGGDWNAARGKDGAGADAKPIPAIVKVDVSCLERVTMIPTYRVVLTIEDIISGTKVSEQVFKPIAIPFATDFEYDRAKLKDGRIYTVRAELRSGSAVLFASDTHPQLATDGSTRHLSMVLVRSR